MTVFSMSSTFPSFCSLMLNEVWGKIYDTVLAVLNDDKQTNKIYEYDSPAAEACAMSALAACKVSK